MRRGGYRRGRQFHNSRQTDENWVVKPIITDHTNQPSSLRNAPQQQKVEHDMPTSDINHPDPNSPQIGRKSNWVSRKRRGRRGKGKPLFISKSEQGSLSCTENELNIQQKEGDSGEKIRDEVDSNEVVADLGRESGEIENYSEGCSSFLLKSDSDGGKIDQEGPDFNRGVDDIAEILENLQVSSEEPELSEELLRINDQLQEDELLAMESIYGDNFINAQLSNGLRSFQVYIHIEIPKEFAISTKLNSSSGPETKIDDSSDFSYSFKVQYLPPIVWTCLLPRQYPSHMLPYFTISVQWLNSSKISNLCSVLDSIWKEQPGQEVIYQWVEWLQSSSLSYLGFDGEIVLGPYGLKHTGDRRAISGSVSPEVDIPSIKSYNDEQCIENFLKNWHECCICFTEFAGTEFIRLPCHHFFCQKCMQTYSEMHVKEGTISKLLCPNEKCGGMVPPGLLKRLLGDEEFGRWESLMLQKTLESMSDVTYCPRCETICIEDEEQHAQCPICFFSFCTLCRERRHLGVACMTAEMKLKILEERQNSSQINDEQKRREREMINDMLSVKAIHSDAKQCPSCKMAISRTEGCNKMVCSNCGQYFCYRCDQAISGYEHFRDGDCELFPREMVQNWEDQMNARQMVGQIQAEMFPERGHPCPICAQINIKVDNNNHIFCWACQNHYCYLCRKMVRKSSQHYGPKGCKQHTVG